LFLTKYFYIKVIINNICKANIKLFENNFTISLSFFDHKLSNSIYIIIIKRIRCDWFGKRRIQNKLSLLLSYTTRLVSHYKTILVHHIIYYAVLHLILATATRVPTTGCCNNNIIVVPFTSNINGPCSCFAYLFRRRTTKYLNIGILQ
jgi:hypothetical protein